MSCSGDLKESSVEGENLFGGEWDSGCICYQGEPGLGLDRKCCGSPFLLRS